MKLRLGTRASDLAITQSRHMAARLHELGHQVEMVPIKTDGDRDQARPFAELGPAGLFVRALEEALLDGRIDLAVHSFKDLPSLSPAGLEVVAMPERKDVRDRLLIARDALAQGSELDELRAAGQDFLPLKRGAVIGTAAARRTALLQDLRPDLQAKLLRGNVPTRVEKLRQGEYDAILLASAGLQRLDLSAQAGQMEPMDRSQWLEIDLDPARFVPAPSQGALALQVRSDAERVRQAVGALDQPAQHRAVQVERELLALVEAGCQVPFGAWCEQRDGQWRLHAYLERGGWHRRAFVEAPEPDNLAQVAWQSLMRQGERA